METDDLHLVTDTSTDGTTDPPIDVSDDASAAVRLPVRRLDPELAMPSYAHPGDAGADLVARVDVTLAPGERALVPTGLAIALPAGYAGFVHPRSGLAARCGVTTLNSPGTIDAGYRGEIQVNLVNTDRTTSVTLRRGDRIAQLVVQRVERARFVAVDDLDASERGTGGHGSTGGFAGASPAGATTISHSNGPTAPEGEHA
jgi:dUTP pyrophosphatase